MKRNILFFALCLNITVHLYAQTPGQEYTNQMNHIFQYVNKSRITTGLLSDYGMQMVEPKYFNGIPADSNYVDMDTWRLLYSGMFTSKINNNVSLIAPETVFAQIDNTTHATAVPLAMMHYQYNVLDENSINRGLLRIVNGDQLQDVPGATSPYLTRQLFAVAPKKLEFDGRKVSFIPYSSLGYTNVNKSIRKMEINFSNETGFLSLNWNTSVSYTFGTGGLKTIYFRVTYTDGTSYTSQTNIHVKGEEAKIVQQSVQFDIDSTPIPPESDHSGGTMYWTLSSNNHTGQIRKPLIVAEGFDASYVVNSMENNNIDHFLKDIIKLGTPSPINSSGGKTLYDDLDLAEYDIVYLDYNNGVDDIWRNAQLFKQVIDTVNTRKQRSGSTEPNVVMGMSMGGLVARIALRQLEIEGYNHQACKYISVDSPHKGANMPVGFQAAVRHIQSIKLYVALFPVFKASDMEAAKGIINLLNSTAAKQMLIYYMNSNSAFDNSAHNAFQTAYDNLGVPQGFAQQPIENIAISNGSNNGSLTFVPGSAIINYQYSYNLKWWMDILSFYGSWSALLTNYPQVAWNTIPGHSEVKAEINIDGLKNQTVSRVYKGKVYIRKKILLLIPLISHSKMFSSTARQVCWHWMALRAGSLI